MKPTPVELPDVLERTVTLAREITFRTKIVPSQPTSLVELLRESGYLSFRNEIDCATLHSALKERAAIVEAWLRYSADKEANWGWFFERDRRPGYSVGLRTGHSPETRCEISNPWEACAYFIKHELEAIVGDPERSSQAKLS